MGTAGGDQIPKSELGGSAESDDGNLEECLSALEKLEYIKASLSILKTILREKETNESTEKAWNKQIIAWKQYLNDFSK